MEQFEMRPCSDAANPPDYMSSATRGRVAYFVPRRHGTMRNEIAESSEPDRSMIVAYLGDHMQGPSGGVHGGAIATVLDACIGLAMNSISNPDQHVTAQLTVNYRRVVPLGSFVLAKACVFERDWVARKAYGYARLEVMVPMALENNLDDRVRHPITYADAAALFVRRKEVNGVVKTSQTPRSAEYGLLPLCFPLHRW